MKKKTDAINYRKFYSDYYNIKIPKGFEIHHIDTNRENNKIDNLLLLPKTIHKNYHKALNQIKYTGADKIVGTIYGLDLSIISDLGKGFYFFKDNITKIYIDLFNSMIDAEMWYQYKMYLDGRFPNIFKFDLRKDNFYIREGFYVR